MALADEIQRQHRIDADRRAYAEAKQNQHKPERRCPKQKRCIRGGWSTGKIAAACKSVIQVSDEQRGEAQRCDGVPPRRCSKKQLRNKRRGEEGKIRREFMDGDRSSPPWPLDARGDRRDRGRNIQPRRKPED